MRACDGNRGFIAERNYHTDLLWNYENFKRLAALPRCHRRLGALPRCSLSRRGLSPLTCRMPCCAAVCRRFALSSKRVGCQPRHRLCCPNRCHQHRRCWGLEAEEPETPRPGHGDPLALSSSGWLLRAVSATAKPESRTECSSCRPRHLRCPCPASLMFLSHPSPASLMFLSRLSPGLLVFSRRGGLTAFPRCWQLSALHHCCCLCEALPAAAAMSTGAPGQDLFPVSSLPGSTAVPAAASG